MGTRHLYWILTGPSFAVCTAGPQVEPGHFSISCLLFKEKLSIIDVARVVEIIPHNV
jgi:hypothetical protein